LSEQESAAKPVVNPLDLLVFPYLGPNASHQNFRVGLANAKALAFILARGDSHVFPDFLAYADEQKKKFRDGKFAIGVCGGPNTPTTMRLGIAISGREIELIQAEQGGFTGQALALIYREAYRIFETYLIDLFEEIATHDKRVLYSNQKMSHEQVLRADPAELQRLIIEDRKSELTRAGFSGLEKIFEGMGLPIISAVEPPPRAEKDEMRRLLVYLSTARNVIEHNKSVVNAEFLGLIPNSGYSIGDRIVIGSTELGDALWAVEHVADDLNCRAIEKFAIG
jgi:hypothetical protein